VDALLAAKKGDDALQQILEIVRSAFPPGKLTAPLIKQVTDVLPRASNLASKETKLIAEIQDEIKTWRAEEAQQKADEAKAQKELDDLKKKNAEEEARLKKQEASKGKPPTAKPGG
jgi:hypothetical protein